MKATEVKKMLLKSIEENKFDIAEHNKIVSALKTIDGKTFTIKTVDKVLLPIGYRLCISAGMFHAAPIEKGERYNDHLIGYNSDNIIDSTKIDKFDSWAFSGAMERIVKLNRLLEPAKFAQLVKAFNDLDKTWKAFVKAAKFIEGNELESYHNVIYYELLTNIGIGSGLMQDVKYNKISK